MPEFQDKDTLFSRIQHIIEEGKREYKASLNAPPPGTERELREQLEGYLKGPPSGAVQLSQFVDDWCEDQLNVLDSSLLTFSAKLNALEYSTENLLAIIREDLPDAAYLKKLQAILDSNDAQYLSLQDTGDVYGWPDELEAA